MNKENETMRTTRHGNEFIADVRHSSNFHAKAIIKKLTSRPHTEDDDGYYDRIADEKHMVEIVEQYLSRHYG